MPDPSAPSSPAQWACSRTHFTVWWEPNETQETFGMALSFMIQLSYPWASLVAQLVKNPPAMPDTSIESVMPSSHLILCCPLLLLPPIPPSIRIFSNESTLHMRWPKYWSFSFSISPSKEHPRLISFRMDWLDLLEVQGTLKSLLQLFSITTVQKHQFFGAQISSQFNSHILT